MKTRDSRIGQSIPQQTHIVVGEPDPAFFRAHADCQIVDESGPFEIIYKRETSRMPKNGYRTPAAIGTPAAL